MISDLIAERRPVYVAGRRFLIRRLSLADVFRVYAALGSRARLADAPTAEAGMKILESIGRAETAELLSLIMEPQDPQWLAEHLDGEAARLILEAVVSMNDVARIFSELRPSDAPGEATVDAISGLELLVDSVARRYCVAPHEVSAWPFEEVLTIGKYVESEIKSLEQIPSTSYAPSGRKVKLDSSTDLPDVLIAGGEYKGRTH